MRVRVAGVCNTDLELVRGYYPYTGVPGHEFVGVVEEAPGAPEWVARRVVGEINAACGACPTCRAGRRTHCERRTVLGIVARDGAFATHLRLPVANLHAVPDGVPDEVAVFTEPTAAALEIQEQVRVVGRGPGGRVGAGKLGNLVAQTLAATGCRLLVVGRSPRPLALLAARGIATATADAIPTRGAPTWRSSAPGTPRASSSPAAPSAPAARSCSRAPTTGRPRSTWRRSWSTRSPSSARAAGPSRRPWRCSPGATWTRAPGRGALPAGRGARGLRARRPTRHPQDPRRLLTRAQPTTKVGTLPPPALTLMTELREARVTAPTASPGRRRTGWRSPSGSRTSSAPLVEDGERLLGDLHPLLHHPGRVEGGPDRGLPLAGRRSPRRGRPSGPRSRGSA